MATLTTTQSREGLELLEAASFVQAFPLHASLLDAFESMQESLAQNPLLEAIQAMRESLACGPLVEAIELTQESFRRDSLGSVMEAVGESRRRDPLESIMDAVGISFPHDPFRSVFEATQESLRRDSIGSVIEAMQTRSFSAPSWAVIEDVWSRRLEDFRLAEFSEDAAGELHDAISPATILKDLVAIILCIALLSWSREPHASLEEFTRHYAEPLAFLVLGWRLGQFRDQ
jgi:hypothetical protein